MTAVAKHYACSVFRHKMQVLLDVLHTGIFLTHKPVATFTAMFMTLGWSENNFFFEIEKPVVLKTCQIGKNLERN